MTSSKSKQREAAKRARAALTDHDHRSERVVRHLQGLPEYASARSVAFYVDVRDEVRTRSLLALECRLARDCGQGARIIAVPYCDGPELRLVRIESSDDLAVGKFGILEPRLDLRQKSAVEIDRMDVIIVPGVGFDRTGNRLGYGAGYYDRLLADAGRVTKIGLAYECQLLDHIHCEPFDVRVDYVCVEDKVIDCRAG